MHKNLQEMEIGRFKFLQRKIKVRASDWKGPFYERKREESQDCVVMCTFFDKYCCDVYLILLFWLVEEICEEKKMQNKFGGVPPRKRKKWVWSSNL